MKGLEHLYNIFLAITIYYISTVNCAIQTNPFIDYAITKFEDPPKFYIEERSKSEFTNHQSSFFVAFINLFFTQNVSSAKF